MTARRLVVSLVALLLGAGTLAVPATASAAPGDDLEVTGFAYGSLPRSTLARDAHALSTLTVDGVGLLADGSGVRAPDAQAVALARAGRTRGLHTELLVHNFSGDLGDFDPRRAHLLLADPVAIAHVSQRLARMVARGGWGGVNVDLELVPRGDAAGLVALCAALQDAMPAAKTVTVDITASTSLAGYRDNGYLLGRLGRVVDRVVLMSYSQHGPGFSGPGPIGGLPWQRTATRTLLQKVPAAKIDLGVGAYGSTWPAAGSDTPARTLTPRGARAMARAAGVRPVWHPRAGEWSVRLPGGTVAWWADARSHRLRVRLAEQLGVGGLAIWRLGSADPLP